MIDIIYINYLFKSLVNTSFLLSIGSDLFPKPIAVVGIIPLSNIEALFPNPLAVDSKEDLKPRLCTVLFLK